MICDRVAQDIPARGVRQITEVIAPLTKVVLVTWRNLKIFLSKLIV